MAIIIPIDDRFTVCAQVTDTSFYCKEMFVLVQMRETNSNFISRGFSRRRIYRLSRPVVDLRRSASNYMWLFIKCGRGQLWASFDLWLGYLPMFGCVLKLSGGSRGWWRSTTGGRNFGQNKNPSWAARVHRILQCYQSDLTNRCKRFVKQPCLGGRLMRNGRKHT